MWATRGGSGAKRGHKDAGRTHDVARWLLQPSFGGHQDIIWPRWHPVSPQRLGETP